tara:strand:+ start:551 stop:1324 length:774 start_codon:yes stop_codon:yes gene_type:complete
MAKTVEQILSKLDRPPASHNFALCNFQRRARTTSALVNLALGFPTVSYQWSLKVISITLADKLSDENAIKLLHRICRVDQYEDNLEFLKAFLAYNAVRQFEGIEVFPEFCGHFNVGPDVSVPVKPTSILRENGKLKPLFIIPWATNSLNLYQRQLLSSIYDDAIYSLTDMRESEGEVLIFPKDGYGIRRPDKWNRNTYEVLSRRQLEEQVERFVYARQDARPLIREKFMKRQEALVAKKAAQHTARDHGGTFYDGDK